MAKTITAEFESIWKRKTGKKVAIRVRYKRRYWNGSAYVYESDWQIVPQDQLSTVGDVSMSLDTQFLSVFTTSNVTITMKNLHNEWLDIATSPSVFAVSNVFTFGAEPYLTKFNLQFAYTLSDDTNEWLSLFTGVAKDYRYNPKNGGAMITCVGNELLMQGADAQNVSDAFTQESTSPATGDGSNVDFLTTSEGVGQITEVRVDGAVQVQGTDYSLSEMNKYNTPALITFKSGSIPPNGDAVDATGLKWKDDETVEDLVSALATEAGIGSGVRTINDVIYPGLSGSKTYNSQADWENGTAITNISTKHVAGDIQRQWFLIDDFDNGNFTSDPVWTQRLATGTVTHVVTAKVFILTAGTNAGANSQVIYTTPQTKAYGTWKFNHKFALPAAALPAGSKNELRLMSSNSSVSANGYGLVSDTSSGVISLVRWDNGTEVTLIANVGTHNSFYVWTITRSAAGAWEVFRDGASKGTAMDSTYSSFSQMMINVRALASVNSCGQSLDYIYWSDEVNPSDSVTNVAAVWESEIHDIGSVPSAWGELDRTETLNGGIIVYYTNVSSDDISYDGWVQVSGDGQINSALKQYFKTKAEITPASGSFDSPVISKLVANFSTTTITVALANHTSKNVYAMVQRYAQIADYEILFDGDGNFIFRSKSPGASPVVELNQGDGITSVTKYNLGYKEVRNVGRVTYSPTDGQTYIDEYDGASASEASPTSEERFGRLTQDEDFSDIFIANDSNLGTARARVIYENNFTPKKRLRIKTKLIPHLDLSDRVRISIYDNPLQRKSIWGDPMQTWGGHYHGWGDVLNVLARDMDCKVIGIVYNINKLTCDLELKEI